MVKIFYDSDASLDILSGKTISIIGYGNQGRAQALNMRDSGVKNIIVGSRRDDSYDKAMEDGFEAYPIDEACRMSDVIFVLIPDEAAPAIYKEQIEPGLKHGCALNFASGYNITFGLISPPEYVDVIMVAPRMIGQGVRESYQNGKGFPSFIAVEKDHTGKAKDMALALAKAIGSTKMGAMEISFKHETYMDLLAEQATWPLILSVMSEVFEFQKGLGIPEEAILMELYISKEPAVMMEKMADMGLFKQLPLHSHTSQYGQLSRFGQVDKSHIRRFIEKQFEYMSSGKFAAEWKSEQEKGLPRFRQLVDEAFKSPISLAEENLKRRMK